MVAKTEVNNAVVAYAKACAALTGKVKKDSTNPHFKSTFASLESVLDTILPACHAAGLYPLQEIVEAEGGIAVQTTLVHESGDIFALQPCPIPVDKNTAQGAISASTYGRRVSLMAIFQLAPSDDDGNAAEAAPPAQIDTTGFERHLDLIDDAPGGQALKAAFTTAVKWAQSLNNQHYVDQFIAAKDEAKDRLTVTDINEEQS
jgi:hypothetical protein